MRSQALKSVRSDFSFSQMLPIPISCFKLRRSGRLQWLKFAAVWSLKSQVWNQIWSNTIRDMNSGHDSYQVISTKNNDRRRKKFPDINSITWVPFVIFKIKVGLEISLISRLFGGLWDHDSCYFYIPNISYLKLWHDNDFEVYFFLVTNNEAFCKITFIWPLVDGTTMYALYHYLLMWITVSTR